jgi:uncharacterized protein with ATP-grasp and redox domains
MISDYRCFFCFVRAFEKLLAKENMSSEDKSAFTNDMICLYHNKHESLTAPEFSRELHATLRSYTNNPDPYIKEKRENNDLALNLYSEVEKSIKQSYDPFGTSLRMAIAGNIIDFAVSDSFNILMTIETALASEFAIDHSLQLKEALKNAKSVLYLGDNAGEIVFDRLFIETLKHPNLTYVVRGGPVINDATMEDAEYTGMTKAVNIISSEYDAPSTIINKSGKLFQQYFKDADLIISKGQGNLEGLLSLNDKRIFFLLMAKCDVMSEFLKVKKNSLVVYNASYLNSFFNRVK